MRRDLLAGLNEYSMSENSTIELFYFHRAVTMWTLNDKHFIQIGFKKPTAPFLALPHLTLVVRLRLKYFINLKISTILPISLYFKYLD